MPPPLKTGQPGRFFCVGWELPHFWGAPGVCSRHRRPPSGRLQAADGPFDRLPAGSWRLGEKQNASVCLPLPSPSQQADHRTGLWAKRRPQPRTDPKDGGPICNKKVGMVPKVPQGRDIAPRCVPHGLRRNRWRGGAKGRHRTRHVRRRPPPCERRPLTDQRTGSSRCFPPCPSTTAERAQMRCRVPPRQAAR